MRLINLLKKAKKEYKQFGAISYETYEEFFKTNDRELIRLLADENNFKEYEIN